MKASTTAHAREVDVSTLSGARDCLACDSTDNVRVAPAIEALGASTKELDEYLVGLPLCVDCAARSLHANVFARRTMLALPLAPLVVTAASVFAVALPPWAALALYAVLAVLVAGAIRALRRKRAALVPVLVLEGRGQTLRLQIAAPPAARAAADGPYRVPDARDLGAIVKATPPADGQAIYMPAAVLVGAMLSSWMWLAANPLVVLDNAAGLSTNVRIDGGPARRIAGGARSIVRLHAGPHTMTVQPSAGAEQRLEVAVRAAKNYLFAVGGGCYNLADRRSTRAHRWSNLTLEQSTTQVTSGVAWIAIGDPADAQPTDCPSLPFTGY